MKHYLNLIFILSLFGCASMAQDGAISLAHKAIAKKDYATALNKLSNAESYKTPSPEIAAQISFMRGISYEGLHRLPEAIGSYKFVTEKYPDSIQAYQAKERLNTFNQENYEAIKLFVDGFGYIKVGDRLTHNKFGTGTIQHLYKDDNGKVLGTFTFVNGAGSSSIFVIDRTYFKW